MQTTILSEITDLQDYKNLNERIFTERPLKKSKYTSIAKLEKLLSVAKGKADVKSDGTDRIISLEEALKEMPKTIYKILAKEQKAKDQFEAFINSNFNTSFVVLIEKNSEKAIHLKINFEDKAITKYFIIVKKGVNASLVEEIITKENSLSNQTIYLEENSVLNHAKTNNFGKNSIAYQQNIIENEATIVNATIFTEGKLVRANNFSVLEGRNSKSEGYTFLLSKNEQHFDLNYTAVHRATDTFSRSIFKGVLRNSSKNVFDGMILIEPTGFRANAFLECHSIILGEKASSNQIPGLEIKTDDVKASHSATVARIDEDELFYLESRGIPKNEAKNMIVKSFMDSVVFMLPEEIRQPIEFQIEKNMS
ncbi:MAG: SufD family Fe-S cluster assembly protein [archaeon]|nr:SufD family Fe-S cluster assembly protein [archaeon]